MSSLETLAAASSGDTSLKPSKSSAGAQSGVDSTLVGVLEYFSIGAWTCPGDGGDRCKPLIFMMAVTRIPWGMPRGTDRRAKFAERCPECRDCVPKTTRRTMGDTRSSSEGGTCRTLLQRGYTTCSIHWCLCDWSSPRERKATRPFRRWAARRCSRCVPCWTLPFTARSRSLGISSARNRQWGNGAGLPGSLLARLRAVRDSTHCRLLDGLLSLPSHVTAGQ